MVRCPCAVYMRFRRTSATRCIQQNLGFHMGYRYNGIPLANESTLQVYMNDAYVSSTPHAAYGQGLRHLGDHGAGAGREYAAVLQHADVRFHLPAAQEREVPGHRSATTCRARS